MHMLDVAITALISEPSCGDPQPARYLLHGVVEVRVVVLAWCLAAILPWHSFLPVVMQAATQPVEGGRRLHRCEGVFDLQQEPLGGFLPALASLVQQGGRGQVSRP